MTEPLQTIRLGAATVTLINVGDIQGAMTAWMDDPPGGWPAPYDEHLNRTERFPTQCVHIALPRLSLLVDAGAYHWPAQSPFAIAHYQPPPSLHQQLQTIGIRPEDIHRVVITHAHHDHFNGTTVDARPAFPNARHDLARADWERAEMQKALQDAQSVESRTLAVLQRDGLLELMEGNRSLGAGAQIIAAAGETPGHQIVRVQSAGHVLYCVGDLFHHPVEIVHPEWMVRWADPATTLASRRALIEAALAENALLIATHIAGVGRLQQGTMGTMWVNV